MTGRFARRLRRDKFPDPELSLGKHLQNLPNDLQVWDATGPALALFDQLSLEIKDHLNKFNCLIKDEVRWTLSMVGKTGATARPTVVFLSPDTGSRRAVKEKINSSEILKNYPGFVTMDCNRPPGCAEMVSLAKLNDTSTSDTEPSSSVHRATNWLKKVEGAVVICEADNGADIREQKQATAGGIFQHGEDFFVMTVAHIFPGYTQGVFPNSTISSEFEYAIDTWSDNEDMEVDIDDVVLEKMSEGSISTPSSDSDGAQFWDKSQSAPGPKELERTNTGDYFGSLTPTCRKGNPEPRSKKVDESVDTINHASLRPDDFSISMGMKDGNLERITLPPILSMDSQDKFLDYALLPISSAQLEALSGKFKQEFQDPAKVPDASSNISKIRPRTTIDIVAITASGGKISGQLLGAPTFMKRTYSENYQELWTVMLHKNLERGDSGSWIYDAKTGEVYGHLIAGSPGAGFGYIVPMVNVLEDLRGRFPGIWQIFTPNTDDEGNNIHSSRHILHDYQNTESSPEIQDFLTWLNSHTVAGTRAGGTGSSNEFVPNLELKRYFDRPQVLEGLLGSISLPENSPRILQRIRDQYVKIFSILVLINQRHLISEFLRIEETDQSLPFMSKPPGLSSLAEDNYFSGFCEKQWAFCAPVFIQGMSLEFEPARILPITSMEELSAGGSAIVYKIVLHPNYNQLLGSSCVEPDEAPQNHPNNTFALKQYRSMGMNSENIDQIWHNEVEAFRMLKNFESEENNLINFFGSYTQSGIHYVILEYASGGNLDQYFHNNPQPSDGFSIMKFWEGLYGILGTLDLIHNSTDRDRPESEVGPVFHGWHQDVKPANILILNSYDNHYADQFKLADLGISHFKRQEKQGTRPVDMDSYGTRTYGAPECYRDDEFISGQLSVEQTVDIWSLGCIFSEAAVWVIHGLPGLSDYKNQRIDAIRAIRIQDDDCFHDGTNLLSFIPQMHQILARNTRNDDYVTAQVLNQLLRNMLTTNNKRASARDIRRQFRRILETAKAKLKTQPPINSTKQISTDKPTEKAIPSHPAVDQKSRGTWAWDHMPSYHLSKNAVDSFLRLLFGPFNFFIELGCDEWRFWIPRPLTNSEKKELFDRGIDYFKDREDRPRFVN